MWRSLWSELYQEVLLQGRAGIVMRALSILDTALWDLNARAAGLPLHKYMGASKTDGVMAYASGGYYLEGKTPDDWRPRWRIMSRSVSRPSR